MSRETDIQVLHQIKNEIAEMESLVAITEEEQAKAKNLQKELENTKFVFKPLPTDQEKTLRDQFKNAWKKRFENTKPFKIIFLLLYSLLVLAFTVALVLDVYHNAGQVVHQLHKYTEPSERVMSAIVPAILGLSVLLLPWYHVVSKESRFSFLKPILIACGVSGLFFAAVYEGGASLVIIVYYLAAIVAGVVLGYVFGGISLLISKIPVYSAKQQAQLAEAKRQDAENTQKNPEKEAQDRAEFDAWWATRKEELKEGINHHWDMATAANKKAKEHLAIYDSIDVLAPDEKTTDVVNWLLHFIESHRADNIKEALHEYDKMKQNQKLLEMEKIKIELEMVKAQKENADRRYQMEMEQRHQLEMEAQAARAAESQAAIAANTAAMRDSVNRMRKDAAFNASLAASTQEQIAADMAAIRRNDYYNS